MDKLYQISLEVNGEIFFLEIRPEETLLDILRNRLGITSPKYGCGKGECGACTVLVDGEPVNSCLILGVELNNHRVVTVEGIMKDGSLSSLQEAFIELGAIQCGFCTPGMIISLEALLRRNPKPSEEEIKTAISGNLCRCTGYFPIVEATIKASKDLNR